MQANNTDISQPTLKWPVYEYGKAFLPIALLTIIFGFSIVYFRTESEINELIDEDSLRLHHISGFIGAQMSSGFNHLQSIYTEPDTQKAINSNSIEDIKLLEQSMLVLAQRNPAYEQVRWIDENGLEKIRISRNQQGPYAESKEELQHKNLRYYFQEASSLPAGQMYASEIDLNKEHGAIELPLQPVLRIATSLEDAEGSNRGIIIINILMTPVFNKVHYLEPETQTGNNILLNLQGDLLHGSLQNVASVEENEPVINVSQVYPSLWKNIAATDSGHFEVMDEIWTWKRVSSLDNLIGLNPQQASERFGFDSTIAGEFSLVFVVQRPLNFVLEMRRNVRLSTFAGVIIVLSVYGMSLFFYFNGHYRAVRAEQSAAFALAHASNMTRLKELEERFRRLVESSSIGQLVVDSEGRIEISNATVERMLGYEKSEMIGTNVDKLLPVDKQQAHIGHRVEFMNNPEPRKMGEGRTLEALRKDGTRVPVEVGLNPYSDQGKKLILVNVIELSGEKNT